MNLKGDRREAKRTSRKKIITDNRNSVRHMWQRTLEKAKTLVAKHRKEKGEE